MDDRLRRAPIGVIEATIDGTVVDVDDVAASAIETAPDELRGTDIRASFPKSADGTLRVAFADDPPAPESFEEYYPRIERWLAVDIDVDVGVGEDVRVYVRDRTEQRETERTVDRLERRLDRIQRIDSLIGTVLQRVVGATDRADVGRTVAEQLGGTDPYRFAWVGERDFPDDRLRMLATAGTDSGLADAIADGLDGEETLPEEAAIRAGEARLVQTIADDESVPGDVRRAAFGRGLQSCLAVPLEYQGTVYGVVSVYSGREDGFGDQERDGLETLGQVAGFAIKAIRQEGQLVADTVTEVTLDVRDEAVPFVRAARETGRDLSLDGAVPRGDGAVNCYLGTDEQTGELDDVLGNEEAVADVRWIGSEREPVLQVTVDGETPVAVLTAWGATVRSAEYSTESARIVAEVPPDGDVRRLVESVDAAVDETRLVSKAETARTAEPVEAFRDALGERLTDRQRTVLRTAYLSEYFASPRGSSSEEVASSLDIASSTMLYHLRRAQRKLAEAYFATDPEAPGSSG